jgi:hypothetical protein
MFFQLICRRERASRAAAAATPTNVVCFSSLFYEKVSSSTDVLYANCRTCQINFAINRNFKTLHLPHLLSLFMSTNSWQSALPVVTTMPLTLTTSNAGPQELERMPADVSLLPATFLSLGQRSYFRFTSGRSVATQSQ